METRFYVTCLWPGLSELWWRGKLSALPVAIGFAVAVNLLLVTRYIYPEWLSSGLVSMAFWIGIIAWGFSVVHSVRELPGLIAPRAISDQPDRFPEARDAYLRGDWQEAEKFLTDLLAIEPRDPPALLLLTGVYRHTGRLEAAEILLEEISRLEVADSWWLELAAEVRRLQRAIELANQSTEKTENELDNAVDLTAGSRSAA
jgi:tetratricopeptide (TPR) repeat protein